MPVLWAGSGHHFHLTQQPPLLRAVFRFTFLFFFLASHINSGCFLTEVPCKNDLDCNFPLSSNVLFINTKNLHCSYFKMRASCFFPLVTFPSPPLPLLHIYLIFSCISVWGFLVSAENSLDVTWFEIAVLF